MLAWRVVLGLGRTSSLGFCCYTSASLYNLKETLTGTLIACVPGDVANLTPTFFKEKITRNITSSKRQGPIYTLF